MKLKSVLLICFLSGVFLPFLLPAQQWIQEGKVQHANNTSGDKFSYSVALTGNLAVLGAPFNDTNSSLYNGNGSVSIYEYDGVNAWNWKQDLTISSQGSLPRLGWSLALDSTTIFAGAVGDHLDTLGTHPMMAAGAVYAYQKQANGQWGFSQKLVASDRSREAYFGWSMALDQNHLLIGARFDCFNNLGGDSLTGAGAVYFFKKASNGNWVEHQKVVASDRDPDDSFGSAVAIKGDWAVVGAWLEDHNVAGQDSLDMAGAAYVLHRDTNGIWTEVQKLVSPDRAASELFGCSVAIGDSTLMVGCYGDSESDTAGSNPIPYAGAVYVFVQNVNGAWVFHQKLLASDRALQDAFGNSLALEGNRLLAGAFQADPPGVSFQQRYGAAYVFEPDNNGMWQETAILSASDGSDPDRFAFSLALSGDKALIGAPYKQAERGSAYFFSGSSITGSLQPLREEMSIYPNPAKNKLWIRPQTPSLNPGPYSYTLINITGTSILKGEIHQSPSAINIEMLKPGLFFLKLRRGDKDFALIPFIKQ